MWLLDTDTCSYILRAHPRGVLTRFLRASPSEIGLSAVVLAELYYGAELLPSRSLLLQDIRDFAKGLAQLPWDAAAAEHYGNIRAELQSKGTPIGAMDMMIAAHARSLNAVLVTNNAKHFRRVPGLRMENWV